MYEDLKAPWVKPKTETNQPNMTWAEPKSPTTPVTEKTPDVIKQPSAVELAAQEYAKKIWGKVEVSTIRENSFFVRNKKWEPIMFKPANAKKIPK